MPHHHMGLWKVNCDEGISDREDVVNPAPLYCVEEDFTC